MKGRCGSNRLGAGGVPLWRMLAVILVLGAVFSLPGVALANESASSAGHTVCSTGDYIHFDAPDYELTLVDA